MTEFEKRIKKFICCPKDNLNYFREKLRETVDFPKKAKKAAFLISMDIKYSGNDIPKALLSIDDDYDIVSLEDYCKKITSVCSAMLKERTEKYSEFLKEYSEKAESREAMTDACLLKAVQLAVLCEIGCDIMIERVMLTQKKADELCDDREKRVHNLCIKCMVRLIGEYRELINKIS